MASEHAGSHGLSAAVSERRRRLREWRHERPFAGGALLILASLVIAWVPAQFAFELMFIGGAYTVIGLVFALLVFLSGAFALIRPERSRTFGIAGIVFSIMSLAGALGGLLIGMVLGIVGGNLCIAWQSDKEDV